MSLGGSGPRSIGRFEIVREIARGGMGAVFLCLDPQLQVQRAVKVLLRDTYDPQEEQRFQREAQALARLQHPHIIPIFEAGVAQGHAYLVLPLLPGGSLADVLKKRGRMRPRAAVELMAKVARAIEHAHQQGIVHRDLKPANILLDESGEPRVTDFGVARDAESREHLTRTGEVLGTAAYMSPEQASGEKGVGPATDIYALGVVLYELLTGLPPFRGSSSINIITKVLTKDPEPMGEQVPGPLREIVRKAMARRPEARYPSAAALADDLQRWLDGGPVGSKGSGGVWKGALAGAVVVVGLLGGGLLLASRGGEATGTSADPLAGAGKPSAKEAVEAGRFAEALGLLAEATDVEQLALRARCYDALGALAAAEEDRWAQLSADPNQVRPLQEVVRSRLASGDVEGLSRGWEEVERRLLLPGEHGWQRLTEDELEDVRAGAQRDARGRLRAALTLQLFKGTEGDLAALSKAPSLLVAEAARATRLAQGAEFLPWVVEHAQQASDAEGCAEALTLLEWAWRLRPEDQRALATLVDARAPLLRAALPLALAVAATREGGVEAAWAHGQLDRIAGDVEPLVASRARLARAALRAVLEGRAPREDPAASLSLALSLARMPEGAVAGWREQVARCAEVMDEALAVPSPSQELRLSRARLHVEQGELDAAERLAGGLEGLAGEELRLLVRTLRGQPASDAELAALPGEDPLARARARERLEAAREFDLALLPGPNGASRIVRDLRRGLEAVERAFDLLSGFRQKPTSRAEGLETQGSTTYSARFLCDEVYSVTVDSQHLPDQDPQRGPPLCSWQVQFDSARFRVGRAVTVDAKSPADRGQQRIRSDQQNLEVVKRQPSDPERVPGVRAVTRRGRVEGGLGDARVSAAPVARKAVGTGRLTLIADQWTKGRHRTRRVVVVGRLSKQRLSEAQRVARWAALPDETLLLQPLARLADGSPGDLGELRAKGVKIRVGGSPHQQWVGSEREHAEALAIPNVTGDFRIRARLRLHLAEEDDWHGAGLALWSVAPYDDVIFFQLYPGSPADQRVVRPHPVLILRGQRGLGVEWSPTLHGVFYEHGEEVLLEVERRGELTFFRYAVPGESMQPLVRTSAGEERGVRLQLSDPLRLCLMASSNDSRRKAIAEFSEVEVEVPAR